MKFLIFLILDMGALNSTSPIQNSAGSPTSPNDLNDSKISVELTPKPRKFFKSRNSAPPAEIQQQMAMQQHQQQVSMQQNHFHHPSSSEEPSSPQKKSTKKKQVSQKKEKVEKPKVEKPPKPEKPLKVKKEKPPPKIKPAAVAKQQLDSSNSTDNEPVSPAKRSNRLSAEATRSSGRARGKLVNYNEEQGEEEFIIRTERRILPRNSMNSHDSNSQISSPIQSPPIQSLPDQQVESLEDASLQIPSGSPSQSATTIHPPIVLRISKVSIYILKTDVHNTHFAYLLLSLIQTAFYSTSPSHSITQFLKFPILYFFSLVLISFAVCMCA